MSESKWAKLSIDSNYIVAGDRMTGEIVVNEYEPDCILVLKSQGIEKVILHKPGMPEKNYSNCIYNLSEELGRIQEPQAVYPFAFKIPSHAPATFEVQDVDPSGIKVNAEVFYFLEFSLLNQSQVIASETLRFIVYNKASRIVLEPNLSFNSELSSCWCVGRGHSQIAIEFVEKSHSSCKQVKKFNISIKSQANNSLVSVIAQVTYDIDFILPGEKPLHIRKIVSRYVPNIQNIKNSSKSLENLEFLFETDFNSAAIGDNPVSNKSVLFISEYKIQVFAIYDVGFRSKRAEGEQEFHINPHSSKVNKPILPEDWNPKEYSLRSFLIDINEKFESKDE